MDMELRAGPEEADIKGNTGKELDMDMVFIDFILEIHMQANGVMGKVMELELKLALMGAPMWVNSSVVLSMALDVTISGELLNFDSTFNWFVDLLNFLYTQIGYLIWVSDLSIPGKLLKFMLCYY